METETKWHTNGKINEWNGMILRLLWTIRLTPIHEAEGFNTWNFWLVRITHKQLCDRVWVGERERLYGNSFVFCVSSMPLVCLFGCYFFFHLGEYFYSPCAQFFFFLLLCVFSTLSRGVCSSVLIAYFRNKMIEFKLIEKLKWMML